MSGRAEKKSVKYRCKYCKREYRDQNAFVKHKRDLHFDQMCNQSKSAKQRMPKKASSLPPLESSFHTEFIFPKPMTIRTSATTPRKNSTRQENSTTNSTNDQEGHSSLEVEGHSSLEVESYSDTKSQNLSSLTGHSSEKDANITEERHKKRTAVKAILGKKMGTRVGLRSSRQGKIVEQTKNMPLPYGKKIKKVDANGRETVEWLRNPTLKGG